MYDITVITPSIPHRTQLLQRCMASVWNQTFRPVQHMVTVDMGYETGNPIGPGALRTSMVDAAYTTWVAFLDDDDTIDANHLEELVRTAESWDRDLHVVYSYCRFDGPPINPIFVNQPYDREILREHGIFPITVLARRDVILDCGGFRDTDQYEDWSLWNRMADSNANFGYVPEVTWTYRTGHESRTKQAMEGRR